MNLINFIFLSLNLFFIGCFGVYYNRKNVLIVILSIELCIISITLLFLIGSSFLDDILGQVYCLFILTVAAAESSLGLSLLINFYRNKGTVSVDLIKDIKG